MEEDERKQLLKSLKTASSLEGLEQLRVSLLGRNGKLTGLFSQMKEEADKTSHAFRQKAQALNQLKQDILETISSRRAQLEAKAGAAASSKKRQDITLDLPAPAFLLGRDHPLLRTRQDAMRILLDLGFEYEEGPEIETEYYNFDALNFDPHHPARQMHDTFYLEATDDKSAGLPLLLRTHTSTIQARVMERGRLPIRAVALGPTYRSDSDQTHTPQFHQMEGFCIDKDIHLGHLKWTLQTFLMRFFELEELKVRFRPSYFPFTEPSFEVDVQCEYGKGHVAIGKGNDWLEILGCGMVHANVLKCANLDPSTHQGFAFGVGLDRLAMLKYGISDLRTMFENNVDWLNHYGCRFLDRSSII